MVWVVSNTPSIIKPSKVYDIINSNCFAVWKILAKQNARAAFHCVRDFLCQNAVSTQVFPAYGEHLEKTVNFLMRKGERIENLRLCEGVLR